MRTLQLSKFGSQNNGTCQALTRKLSKPHSQSATTNHGNYREKGHFQGNEATPPRETTAPTSLPNPHTYCQSILEFPLIAKRQKTQIICLREWLIRVQRRVPNYEGADNIGWAC